MMSTADDRVLYAQLLVELGEGDEAEREIAEVLDESPDHLTALNLYAKIKHMRGELSQAIACWARIHAQSPHNEVALMTLASILRFAKDPERAAGELLAMGRFVQKPAAHLELEEAFRLFLARRADEARAHCDRVAVKYQGKDANLYKLAVIGKAWVAELSGDLLGAATILEGLGRERGFETDTDRVLALARVYERIGTPERLEKAAHIFRFLDRSYGKMSAVVRLAHIHRRLGDAALAAQYEARYEGAFRRRMHRPSIADAAYVAASTFVPLEMLRRARLVAAQSPRELSARERAIVAFLDGRTGVAHEELTSGGELLDAKYLAELAVIGEAQDADKRLADVLARDPDDMRLLAIALRKQARARGPEVERVLRDAELRARVVGNLEAALKRTPLRASAWRDLANARALFGAEREALRCAERAAALEDAALRDKQTIGRVLAAAVYQFVGKTKGLIHQIWVDRTPAEPGRGGFLAPEDILGNVTLEMKQSVRNTFFAVREYARSRFPQQAADILDYNYTYKVTKEDEPSGGLSAGLPTALAFLSVFVQRAVPQDIAFSGAMIADAHDALVVRNVGDVAYKVKAAYHRNLRMVVLPAENRAELSDNPQVPRAVCEEIVRYARTLDDAVALTFGDDVWLS